MATRKIVQIDKDKCNGCGLCIPNCVEGALQIIDGKAKLLSDTFCDGLGACLRHCPQDAITIIEREAADFDETAAESLLHKKEREARPNMEPLFAGCPSSRAVILKTAETTAASGPAFPTLSQLSHWPIQLKLVPVNAPYFHDADLLVVGDCVPFAYANFHHDFLRGKAVVVGCPKLDDLRSYREKMTEILRTNSIRSVMVAFMEVPCCFGLVKATEDALKASGKNIPLKKVKIGVQGDRQSEEKGFEHSCSSATL